MSEYSEEVQLEALFGPAAPYSDHKRNETIRFRENGVVKTGRIIWVCRPGTTVQGKHHPVTYVVDCDAGFPSMVYPSDVVVE